MLTHAHGTLATLQPAAGPELLLNLAGPIAIDVVERATGGGRARQQYGPETFLARLRELELADILVELMLGFTEDRPRG